MNTNHTFAGICSILVGLFYVAAAVAYLMTPGALKESEVKFYELFSENAKRLKLYHWVLGLAGLLAMPAISAVPHLLADPSGELLHWTMSLAYLGFAVQAVSAIQIVSLEPMRASLFVKGDATTRSVIAATGDLVGMDDRGWFRFGCVGLWLFTVNVLGLIDHSLPVGLACLGIGASIAFAMIIVGTSTESPKMIALGAIGGGVIGAPLWYIWVGVRLLQSLPAAGV